MPWCPSKQVIVAAENTGEDNNNEAFLERSSEDFGLTNTRSCIYICVYEEL